MSDTDLDEKGLEAAAKATHPEAFDPPPHWTNGDIAWAKERARDQAKAAIRAYNAAEGVGPVAWAGQPGLDRLASGRAEWIDVRAKRGIDYYIVPLYAAPQPARVAGCSEPDCVICSAVTELLARRAPASAGVTPEGTRLTYYAELRRELEVLLAARPAPPVEG